MTDRRTIADTDLAASVVGLGCNNFGMFLDRAATEQVVHAAVDVGINFFDTAASYGGGTSEQYLGSALTHRRDQVLIATKFPMTRGDGSCTPDRIRADCEASLQRLGCDHIDLYQQHYPDDTPHDDVLATLAELVSEGKVRAVGHSNFTAAMHDAGAAAADGHSVRFVSSQLHWNLLDRAVEASVVPAAERNGLGVLPYFPLASGLLTGKHRRDAIERDSRLDERKATWFTTVLTDENFDRVEALNAWADDHDRTLLELAFQWLADQPSVVSVIAGATTADQVLANARAITTPLDPDELREVSSLAGKETA